MTNIDLSSSISGHLPIHFIPIIKCLNSTASRIPKNEAIKYRTSIHGRNTYSTTKVPQNLPLSPARGEQQHRIRNGHVVLRKNSFSGRSRSQSSQPFILHCLPAIPQMKRIRYTVSPASCATDYTQAESISRDFGKGHSASFIHHTF